MNIELREMNEDELVRYKEFSYENHLDEVSKASGQTTDEVKISMQTKSSSVTQDKTAIENLWRVVVFDGLDVGYIWVQINHKTNSAFGYDIYLDEEYRSNGIGRKVMNAGKELVISKGVKSLKIHVFERNIIARALYDSLGFKLSSTNSRGDAHEMVLELL